MFGGSDLGWQAVYGFLETGIGVGNLLGGFVIGLIGARLGKGRLVIAGYAVWGLMVALMALTGHVGLAIGFSFGQGVANMVFVIPTQTLFQELTPPSLMGRVVGIRFAITFGSMTIAMALGAVMAEFLDVSARDRVLRIGDDDRGAGRPVRARHPGCLTDGRLRGLGTLAPASRSQTGAHAPRRDTTE